MGQAWSAADKGEGGEVQDSAEESQSPLAYLQSFKNKPELDTDRKKKLLNLLRGNHTTYSVLHENLQFHNHVPHVGWR